MMFLFHSVVNRYCQSISASSKTVIVLSDCRYVMYGNMFNLFFITGHTDTHIVRRTFSVK